jgi:3-hydroxymyristoyl/3-hydroxydecanoyl-(acyl carrier protein) dehydratase
MRFDADVFEAMTIADGDAYAVVRRAHAERLCAGHFPGDPLVPGAFLAGLMADVALWLVGQSAEGVLPLEIVRSVFLAPVRPDAELTVSAHARGPHGVDAEVHSAGRCAARATFRLGAR